MVSLLSLAVLVLAVSLDGFGVGLMYGLRRITIPFLSVMIISTCSGLMMLIAMLAGEGISQLLSEQIASMIGAMILIVLGIWAVMNTLIKGHDKEEACQIDQAQSDPPDLESENSCRRLIQIEIRMFGLVIEVLKRPVTADMDRSGNISASEAILLGTALSLDAFGAGIGAAFIQLSPWMTPLIVVLTSGVFLLAGLRYGASCAKSSWTRSVSILPGLFLILIGIMKLL